MNSARKAGTIKSWTCVVALTFFLPAGATHLANSFLQTSGIDGDKILALFSEPSGHEHAPVQDCPDQTATIRL